MMLHGEIAGKETALGLINSGQYGFDLKDGEIRLSVLRSPPYCHQWEFPLRETPQRKYMDQGVHDVRLLITTGDYVTVRDTIAGLADWLTAPPFALAHFPIGDMTPGRQELITFEPSSIRLIACKRSWDGDGLILRCQETVGVETRTRVHLHNPSADAELVFNAFEIKTLRFERNGSWREVAMIEEV
jgi:alpha-mannosidase